MNQVWTLRALRWSYVAFIAAASANTALGALHGSVEDRHGGHAVLLLAIPEFLAALAFLIEPIEIAACAVLLLVYVAAGTMSVVLGDWLGLPRFVLFATIAIYIANVSRSFRALTPFPPRRRLMGW